MSYWTGIMRFLASFGLLSLPISLFPVPGQAKIAWAETNRVNAAKETIHCNFFINNPSDQTDIDFFQYRKSGRRINLKLEVFSFLRKKTVK